MVPEARPRRAAVHFLLLAAVCLVPTFAPFLNGYLISHDLLYILPWTDLFQQQLFTGDLYPRWLFDMNGGRGSPAFYFCPPVPYYASALFALVIPGENQVWLSIGAVYAAALLASTIGMYLYMREFCTRNVSLLLAALCASYPYHLLIDLHVRFAFAEFAAIAWVPLLFYSIRRARSGEARWLYLFIGTYALLILTHLPTTMLFTPVLLAYLLIERRGNIILNKLPHCAAGALALTAFYLAPIALYRSEVLEELLTASHMYFANSFLVSGEALSPRFSGFLFSLNLLNLLAFAVLLLGILASRPSRAGLMSNFFLLVSLGSLFMMYPLSAPLWQLFPVLQIVQFPWRWNIVLSFSLFLYLATSGAIRPGRGTPPAARAGVAVLLVLSAVSLTASALFGIREIAPEHTALIEQSLGTHTEGGLGLLPRGVDQALLKAIGERSVTPVSQLFTTNTAGATLHHERHADSILLEIQTPTPATIRFSQFYFPTWTAQAIADDALVPIERTADGTMVFRVDRGQHRLRLWHRNSRAEIAANLTSGAALSLLLVCSWRSRHHPDRRRNSKNAQEV